MKFLLLLICTIAFCWLLRKQIRQAPWVFYLLAFALNLGLLANQLFTLPFWAVSLLSPLMQKGGLGVAFFVLVMWIGVFPRGGKLSKAFRPIRAELSITACILIAGHMSVYMVSYLPRFLAGLSVKPAVAVAFAIACMLLALILLLGVTSLRAIKRHMSARSWKKLQCLAYPFYGLVLIHLLLMLGPSALNGSAQSMVSVIVYILVFGGYLVARTMRAIADKREAVDLAETVKDQGFKEDL